MLATGSLSLSLSPLPSLYLPLSLSLSLSLSCLPLFVVSLYLYSFVTCVNKYRAEKLSCNEVQCALYQCHALLCCAGGASTKNFVEKSILKGNDWTMNPRTLLLFVNKGGGGVRYGRRSLKVCWLYHHTMCTFHTNNTYL